MAFGLHTHTHNTTTNRYTYVLVHSLYAVRDDVIYKKTKISNTEVQYQRQRCHGFVVYIQSHRAHHLHSTSATSTPTRPDPAPDSTHSFNNTRYQDKLSTFHLCILHSGLGILLHKTHCVHEPNQRWCSVVSILSWCPRTSGRKPFCIHIQHVRNTCMTQNSKPLAERRWNTVNAAFNGTANGVGPVGRTNGRKITPQSLAFCSGPYLPHHHRHHHHHHHRFTIIDGRHNGAQWQMTWCAYPEHNRFDAKCGMHFHVQCRWMAGNMHTQKRDQPPTANQNHLRYGPVSFHTTIELLPNLYISVDLIWISSYKLGACSRRTGDGSRQNGRYLYWISWMCVSNISLYI